MRIIQEPAEEQPTKQFMQSFYSYTVCKKWISSFLLQFSDNDAETLEEGYHNSCVELCMVPMELSLDQSLSCEKCGRFYGKILTV